MFYNRSINNKFFLAPTIIMITIKEKIIVIPYDYY